MAKPRVLCAALVLVLCAACTQKREPLSISGPTMGTKYSVKYVPTANTLPQATLKHTMDTLLKKINGQMSTYQADSELSLLNKNTSTTWIPISKPLLKVVSEAQQISQWSEGAFDITVGPLVNLWGFGPKNVPNQVPTEKQIKKAKQTVGYKQLHLQKEPPALKKDHAKLYVDLSAIAKGYAVDVLAQQLEALDIHDYLVEVGGELRAKGQKPNGSPWQVAIEKPVTGQRTVHKSFSLKNQAIATSGDYRNYFEKQGKRYSHTIHPRTGKPITHKLASVTVFADTCMRADALATALNVLGPEKGLALAKRLGIQAIFLVKKPKEGFQELVTGNLAKQSSE